MRKAALRVNTKQSQLKDPDLILRKTITLNSKHAGVMLAAALILAGILLIVNYTPSLTGALVVSANGILNCTFESSSSCSAGTKVLGVSNQTNTHAELANINGYGFSVCCDDTSGNNTIGTSSSGIAFMNLANDTNAHVELANESNYLNISYISASGGGLSCTVEAMGNGACSAGQICLATLSNYTNAHVSNCSAGAAYNVTICCGFGGFTTYYFPPSSGLASLLTANGSVNGTLAGADPSYPTQVITYLNTTSGIKYFEVTGNFNTTNVNLTTLQIQANTTAVATNTTGISGTGTKHDVFLKQNGLASLGVRVCPNAELLTEISDGCSGKLEFYGPFPQTISGITVLEEGDYYRTANLTSSGAEILSVVNSTIINSTLTNSTALNSTIENSNKTNSTILYSTVNNSVNLNCSLYNTTELSSHCLNSEVNNSEIVNSTLENLTVMDANITNDNCYWGTITYQGLTYNCPATLTEIYTGGVITACPATINIHSKLESNLVAPGSCITFGSSNIQLDCQGHTIDYANSIQGNAIIASGKVNIITKNCILDSNDAPGLSSSPAINFTNVNDSSILNNTIRTNGSQSTGIELNQVIATNVTNNTVSAGAADAIKLIGGRNNILTTNNGQSVSGAAISLVSNTYSNRFYSDVATTTSDASLKMAASQNNSFIDTTLRTNNAWITTDGTSSGNNLTRVTFDNPATGSIGISNTTLQTSASVNVANLLVTSNKAFLNSTTLSFLNVSSNITLKGLSYLDGRPKVDFEDDGSYVNCDSPQCTNFNMVGTTATFNVSSFTSYTVVERPVAATMSKSDSPDPLAVNVSTQLNYSILINVSEGTAVNATVTENYPPQVTFVSAQPSPTTGNNIFALGNLVNGTIYVVNITVSVYTGLNNGTVINNSVNLTYYNATGGQLLLSDLESTLITNSVFNSVIINSTVTNSTKIDSTITNSDNVNCNVENSTETNVDCQDSTITDSTKINTDMTNSTIDNSVDNNCIVMNSLENGTICTDSTFENSTVINSTVNDMTLLNATVIDDYCSSGQIIYMGKTYDCPISLSEITSGVTPGVTPAGGGGGATRSGGGGRGGGLGVRTIYMEGDSLITPPLRRLDRVVFNINDEEHVITITRMLLDSVTLTFTSRAQDVTLFKNKWKLVDVNYDGIPDIRVDVLNLQSPTVILQLIKQPQIPLTPTAAPEPVQAKQPEPIVQPVPAPEPQPQEVQAEPVQAEEKKTIWMKLSEWGGDGELTPKAFAIGGLGLLIVVMLLLILNTLKRHQPKVKPKKQVFNIKQAERDLAEAEMLLRKYRKQ